MCISVAFRAKLQYNLIKVYKLFSLHYALLVLWLLCYVLKSMYLLLPGWWYIAICISIIAILSKLVYFTFLPNMSWNRCIYYWEMIYSYDLFFGSSHPDNREPIWFVLSSQCMNKVENIGIPSFFAANKISFAKHHEMPANWLYTY